VGRPRELRNNIIAYQEKRGGIWLGIYIGAFMSWKLVKFQTAISFRIAVGPPNGQGQYFNSYSPANRWIRTAVKEMRQHADRPLVFRLHSADKLRDDKWLLRHGVEIDRDRVGLNLHQVVDNEWAVVTYSSCGAKDVEPEMTLVS
jgi:hypothetical protein